MCAGKTIEVAHIVATVSTRVSPQTINQKSKYKAAMVNGTQNRKF